MSFGCGRFGPPLATPLECVPGIWTVPVPVYHNAMTVRYQYSASIPVLVVCTGRNLPVPDPTRYLVPGTITETSIEGKYAAVSTGNQAQLPVLYSS